MSFVLPKIVESKRQYRSTQSKRQSPLQSAIAFLLEKESKRRQVLLPRENNTKNERTKALPQQKKMLENIALLRLLLAVLHLVQPPTFFVAVAIGVTAADLEGKLFGDADDGTASALEVDLDWLPGSSPATVPCIKGCGR